MDPAGDVIPSNSTLVNPPPEPVPIRGARRVSPMRRCGCLFAALALLALVVAACGGDGRTSELDRLRQENEALRAAEVERLREENEALKAAAAETGAGAVATSTPAPVPSRPATTTPPASSTPTTAEPALSRAVPEDSLYIAATGGLGVSLRDSCSASARVDGSWPEGTLVQRTDVGLGACSGWSIVRAAGTVSWVEDRYLSSSRPTPTPPPVATGAPAMPPAVPTVATCDPAGSWRSNTAYTGGNAIAADDFLRPDGTGTSRTISIGGFPISAASSFPLTWRSTSPSSITVIINAYSTHVLTFDTCNVLRGTNSNPAGFTGTGTWIRQ